MISLCCCHPAWIRKFINKLRYGVNDCIVFKVYIKHFLSILLFLILWSSVIGLAGYNVNIYMSLSLKKNTDCSQQHSCEYGVIHPQIQTARTGSALVLCLL
uniref:Uncharacterized protein n=1 Tax=Anguilla anguilla TaxID=7936 RepID=A0A0E9Y0Q0_ANGAN